MKKLFASIVVLGATSLTAVCVNASTSKPIVNFIQQDEKTVVKSDDLPATVKTTLSTNYDGWAISSASLDKGNYVVELKKGDDKKTVTLDKDGKIVG